jgi:two-component system chemotaxis response regulator CheB
MTLDVEMPRMNGLEFLEKVMRLRPLPVVMVSSLTERGAAIAIDAMQIGAVDCVSKPTIEHPDSFADLAETVKAAAGARVGSRPSDIASKPAPARGAPNGRLVAIGASTGGVEALVAILSRYPVDCSPTVVTLHLPAPFTKTFAQRLDRVCAPKVSEAAHGAPILPGNIYVAPGSVAHLEVAGTWERPRCALREGDLVSGHRPSVDVLFHSVAKTARAKAVGVILTGMGADGARGLLEMRRAGAKTLGQDEASSVVYGMPRVASIAAEISSLTSNSRGKD